MCNLKFSCDFKNVSRLSEKNQILTRLQWIQLITDYIIDYYLNQSVCDFQF